MILTKVATDAREVEFANQAFIAGLYPMNLNDAELGEAYVIEEIDTGGDEEMEGFLFSLGCYSGEEITVVDKKKNLVVSIKDARYNIDPELAEAIKI